MARSFLKRQFAALILGLGLVIPAAAQDLYAPRLYVNDRAISEFEVQQRMLFLQVLRAPGNPEEEALKALIEDRLRLTEADRLGLKLTEEQVKAGMTEFAARANLSTEQLVAELEKVGIAAETFRDFVSAGLLWREAVRARFLGQVPISEADVDRALEASARPRALKVLASEIVIPLQPGQEQDAIALAERLSDEIGSEAEFAAAARRYSRAPTASRGGQLDWVPLANLPAAIG
ncbi:MAG: peptidylprolyl isomerase, partial [Tabrizicola sp.]|nr:peptidylprolyl isomerase [Tabrizicola sp.]